MNQEPTHGIPAPEEKQGIPLHEKLQPLGAISGCISRDDIIVPRLDIVQGVGPLAGRFPLGSIVFNKETLLSDGHEPLELTILSARKQFVQKLPFEARKRALVFDTLEDVRRVGGRMGREKGQGPVFSPILHVQLAFKAPQDTGYPYPLHDGNASYGLAAWTLRGAAYFGAGRSILTAASFGLKDSLFRGKWQLTTRIDPFGNHQAACPTLRHEGEHSPAFVEFLQRAF